MDCNFHIKILPKWTYRFNAISAQIPTKIFVDTDISKIYVESYLLQNSSNYLEIRIKQEELLYLIIKLYRIATVIKILCFWQRNKHMDLRNEIENPEITQCKYAQLILCNVLKMQFNKRKITFSINSTVESAPPKGPQFKAQNLY